MRPATTPLALALTAFVVPGSGCFNSWFQEREDGSAGGIRFELQIEPNRTLVDGTHFLLDRATGDLWRLDASSGTAGRWVRLADGPDDVRELAPPIDEEGDEDES